MNRLVTYFFCDINALMIFPDLLFGDIISNHICHPCESDSKGQADVPQAYN